MLRCTTCGRLRPDGTQQCQHCGSRAANYEPTLDEIRAACIRIQLTWSPCVERRRRGIEDDGKMTVTRTARRKYRRRRKINPED